MKLYVVESHNRENLKIYAEDSGWVTLMEDVVSSVSEAVYRRLVWAGGPMKPKYTAEVSPQVAFRDFGQLVPQIREKDLPPGTDATDMLHCYSRYVPTLELFLRIAAADGIYHSQELSQPSADRVNKIINQLGMGRKDR